MTDPDPIVELEVRKAELSRRYNLLLVDQREIAGRIEEVDRMLTLLRGPERKRPGPKPGSTRAPAPAPADVEPAAEGEAG